MPRVLYDPSTDTNEQPHTCRCFYNEWLESNENEACLTATDNAPSLNWHHWPYKQKAWSHTYTDDITGAFDTVNVFLCELQQPVNRSAVLVSDNTNLSS